MLRRIAAHVNARAKSRITFIVRWGIAIAGIWYVLSNLSWHDSALSIVDSSMVPRWGSVVEGSESSATLTLKLWNSGKVVTVDRANLVSEPDVKKQQVKVDGAMLPLLGVDLAPDESGVLHVARRLLVEQPRAQGVWISPERAPDYKVSVPHPKVQIGVHHLVAWANRQLLLLSILIFPLTFIITAFRWHELLKALEIILPASRTFVLNMVGAFYNTFMPGSTGGDVLKAYYVAKQTHHRTRAVMSVLVDRVIGLLALIIMGGGMAAFVGAHWGVHQASAVAIAAGAILLCTAMGLVVFYSEHWRRATGLDWLIGKLPMQEQVHKAVEAMHLYGKRPALALGALLVSFPVHGIVVISATLAGLAFGLHIPWYVYWSVVPTVVLVGAIPLAPQGAGVMEAFAILLLQPLGCTLAEALALTMSIRLVPLIWNLAGGVFVLRGGYHTPTQDEQRQVEQEDEDQPR